MKSIKTQLPNAKLSIDFKPFAGSPIGEPKQTNFENSYKIIEIVLKKKNFFEQVSINTRKVIAK